MTEKILNIKQLAYPCISRERAKEAALKVLRHLKNRKVVIDLNGIEMLSFSFLDELIFWIAGSANMRNIVFRVNDPVVQDKLARIVTIRHVFIYFQTDNEKPQLLQPKKLKTYEASLGENKSLLKP